MLLSSWCLLAFLVACSGLCFVARVCISVVGLVHSSFLCPLGQRFIVAIYMCSFTCGCSLLCISVQGVLIDQF